MYDYLIAGGGLFGAVFAYEAAKKFIRRALRESTFTDMAHIFSTHRTRRFGLYKYLDMDKVIAKALETVNNELC